MSGIVKRMFYTHVQKPPGFWCYTQKPFKELKPGEYSPEVVTTANAIFSVVYPYEPIFRQNYEENLISSSKVLSNNEQEEPSTHTDIL